MSDALNATENAVREYPSRLFPRSYDSGQADERACRSVDFYGRTLANPLEEAVRFLRKLEEVPDKTPRILCMHEEFSWEDEGSELAWRVTLVFSDPVAEAG